MKPKVVLGMSGGVDSSVAALLLQQQGYEVIGMFMHCNIDNQNRWPTTINWQEEEKHLKGIAKKLHIKLIIKDCAKGYEEKVIKEMFKNYAKGLTPNPDILCNNVGKFPLLLKTAKEENATFIATGHYAQIKHNINKQIELHQAQDKNKDQSYFLTGLGKKYLNKCLFPLGKYTKEQVRQIAKKHKFSNWNKTSSKGICYLGKIDIKDFLKTRIKENTGNVLDPKGNTIGTHPGTYFFTIGEKLTTGKGFKLNKKYTKLYSQQKLFIAKKDKKNNIIVAPQGHKILQTKQLQIHGIQKVDKNEEIINKTFNLRIRNLGDMHKGKVSKENNKYIFTLNKPIEQVAPGQFAVLYEKTRVVGGGEIRLI